jgi:hypothetical protein
MTVAVMTDSLVDFRLEHSLEHSLELSLLSLSSLKRREEERVMKRKRLVTSLVTSYRFDASDTSQACHRPRPTGGE